MRWESMGHIEENSPHYLCSFWSEPEEQRGTRKISPFSCKMLLFSFDEVLADQVF
jgi:hypothetical protein